MESSAFAENQEPILDVQEQTGWVQNLPFENYCAIEAANAHGLSDILVYPALFKANRERPKKPTKAMEKGSRLHTAILEPKRFREIVLVAPEFTGLTKDGRESKQSGEAKKKKEEWYASLPPGSLVVTEEESQELVEMIAAIQAHPKASKFLESGVSEVSGFFTDKETGVRCKMRADYLLTITIGGIKRNFVVDYKTTADASVKSFTRDAYNYDYPIQAAHYLNGYKTITGESAEFMFVAQETRYPYAVRLYIGDQAFMEYGEAQLRQGLRIYKECTETNTWPAYPTDIENLGLPKWAFYDQD